MSLKTKAYGFLFAFHSNYGTILSRFRDRDAGRKLRVFHTVLYRTIPGEKMVANIFVLFS